MHDLDRALQEFEADSSALEMESEEFDLEADAESDYEGEDEYEYEADSEYEGEDYESETEEMRSASHRDEEAILDELEEMEQAAALLEVQNEEELEYFLGGLVNKVKNKIRKALPPGVQKALGSALKKVAKTALPKVGAVLGNMVVPGLGGMVGAGLASNAGQMFGLELEGMSYEDQEFEIARRVVKLGAEATRTAAVSGAANGGSTTQAAKTAVLQAAQTHAPGLVSAAGNPALNRSRSGRAGSQRTGRWFRRGRRIILVGA